MRDSMEEIQTGRFDLLDILIDIRLTNITEIKIVQEVVSSINAKYQEHQKDLQPATLAALILNRQEIPNLYATSSRGYNKQRLKFQNQYSVLVREKLLPWAIDKVLMEKLPQSLHQDLTMAINSPKSQDQSDETDIFEILANINLANVTEFQVIEEAFTYIYTNYPGATGRINLSDVCALILNHKSVSSLYATSAEEYNQHKQTYISQYQPQVKQIIHQMVAKVHAEGSEHSLSQDSLISVNHQRRKKLTKSWNT